MCEEVKWREPVAAAVGCGRRGAARRAGDELTLPTKTVINPVFTIGACNRGCRPVSCDMGR